jgi:3-oxoacyl-[acyl-carrier protein] reductase
MTAMTRGAPADSPVPTRERPLELYGRVAVVTGGAKGIGRAVSELLVREGARVVLGGRDAAALDELVRELSAGSSETRAVAQVCDVTSETDTQALARRALDSFGRIDILVNTAGGTGPIETPVHEYPADEFRRILELNVIGTFLPCKAVIPSMIENGYGRIVNLAGTSGLRGYRNRSGYSSSKWAVRGFTRTLALELGHHGITVNDVCPNVTNGARMDRIVRTKAERVGKTAEQVYDEFASQTALGRFVDEGDVAEAVLFLVSERARNMTGHDVVVDAGWDV